MNSSLRRSTQWALGATLAICAVLIVCRTWFGPFRFPIPVRSPMNVEGIFGLAVLLLLLMRATPASPEMQSRYSGLNRLDAVALVMIALAVAVAFWRTIPFYFLSDDFLIVKHARSWHGFRDAFTVVGADRFYRPVTFAYMAWVATWAGLDPALWRAIELGLHAANSCLLFILARTLGFPRFAAGFAAALFAVHATRPETVVWIAGRADLLTTFFVLLSLVFFIRSWDAPRSMSVFFRLASFAAMSLAFISKESSYTLPLLLGLWLAVNGGLKDRRGWYAFLPFFTAAACLFAWRWILFGGIGGYADAAGRPQALSLGFVPVLNTFGLRLWAVLFFPINWSVQPGVVLGIVTTFYVAALFSLSSAAVRRRDLVLTAGWLLALALPPVQQLLIGADLQKARYLYLPSTGFCLLLAAAVTRLNATPRWAVATAVLMFHAVALAHNLSAWQYASEKAKSACAAVTACVTGPDSRMSVLGLPGSLNGVYFFANGFPECVAMQRNFEPVKADLTETIPDAGKYSCLFRWDTAEQELRRLKP